MDKEKAELNIYRWGIWVWKPSKHLPSDLLGNTETKNVIRNEVPDSQCFIYEEVIRSYSKVNFDCHIPISVLLYTCVYATLNITNFQLSSGCNVLLSTCQSLKLVIDSVSFPRKIHLYMLYVKCCTWAAEQKFLW